MTKKHLAKLLFLVLHKFLIEMFMNCFGIVITWHDRWKKWSWQCQYELVGTWGANRISWTTPAPLGECLLNVYSKILLEYSEQNSLKCLLKILKFSSHYYIMVYIKKNSKNMSLSKNSNPFTSPFTI
jgi:hypothetical protein